MSASSPFLSSSTIQRDAIDEETASVAINNGVNYSQEDDTMENARKTSLSGSTTTLTNVPPRIDDNEISNNMINLEDIPGTSKGNRKLAIIYTCKVCNIRSSKRFAKQAYNHGVIIIWCTSCEILHLIANWLGYFSDKGEGEWDISKIGGEDGTVASVGTSDGVLELTIKDVVGKDLWNEAGGNESGSGDIKTGREI